MKVRALLWSDKSRKRFVVGFVGSFRKRFCVQPYYLGKDETSGNTSDATRIHDIPIACKAQKEDDFGVFTKQVSEETILPAADSRDSSSDSRTTVDSDGDEEAVIANVIATMETKLREKTPTTIEEDQQRCLEISDFLTKTISKLVSKVESECFWSFKSKINIFL